MLNMKSIKELKNLKGKKVLMRVDFNVPVQDGKVMDDFRIKKSVPSILYLLGKGASVHLLMHLGEDGSLDIEPVKKHFFKITKFPTDRVTFSENIRKYKEELAGDKNFAKKLSFGFDAYVNEAFSVSHRPHASIVGIPKYLPAYAGFQFLLEIKNLSMCFKNTKHPFLFILGGAKFSTKMPLVKKFLKKADHVFVGGALFNDILETFGFSVGKSLVDKNFSLPKTMLKNKKFIFAKDVLVKNGENFSNKNINEISKEDEIYDMGPESVLDLVSFVKKAKFILWNGPLGKYENGGEQGTKKVLKAVAENKNISIIGGGDTVEIINEMKLNDKFTFVSTGGGATLEFLSKGTLPGIKALK